MAIDSVLTDLHIAAEAARHSFSILHKHLYEWLDETLCFDPMPFNEYTTGRCWRFLGIEPEWVDLFIEVRPLWGSGLLYVNSELLNDPEGMVKISSVWGHSMKWRRFNDARWLSFLE